MTESAELTVYYNGECPICRHEIESYRRRADRTGANVAWRDIATDRDALSACGRDRDDVARRLHVVDRAGRVHAGVDAFERLWRCLPGLGWLARLLDARLGRAVATVIYDGVCAPLLFALHKRRRRKHDARINR